MQPGLLSCAQACRTLPRQTKDSTWCKAWPSTVQDTSNTACPYPGEAHAVQREFEALRPHYPPLTLSLLSTAHVKHQVLPRPRSLRPRRPPRPLLSDDSKHSTRHANTPFAEPQTLPLHPRRFPRPVQTRVLVARRGRLYHRSDVAIPWLQVERTATAIRECARHVCW